MCQNLVLDIVKCDGWCVRIHLSRSAQLLGFSILDLQQECWFALTQLFPVPNRDRSHEDQRFISRRALEQMSSFYPDGEIARFPLSGMGDIEAIAGRGLENYSFEYDERLSLFSVVAKAGEEGHPLYPIENYIPIKTDFSKMLKLVPPGETGDLPEAMAYTYRILAQDSGDAQQGCPPQECPAQDSDGNEES